LPFFIAYGTKSWDGLKTFRQTEYDALREHARNRANAKERQREERSGTSDLFTGLLASDQEITIDQIVDEQKKIASEALREILKTQGPTSFQRAAAQLLQAHMLRETNIKDICVDLAKADVVENNWGSGNRKPKEATVVRLKAKP
jgi:hypothetical protein